MSQPESDPTESVTVSAADMAILADELKSLRTQRNNLRDLLKELIDIEGLQPGTAEWSDRVIAAIAGLEGGAS